MIDLSPRALLRATENMLDDDYRLDTLHLNDAGYIRLAEALAAEIERMLESPPSSRVQ